MSLRVLRDYLETHQRANLAELARHIKTNPCVVEGMLAHWINKGIIQEVKAPPGCGSTCHKCDLNLVKTFEIVG